MTITNEEELKTVQEQVTAARQKLDIAYAETQRLNQTVASIKEDIKNNSAFLEDVKGRVITAQAKEVQLQSSINELTSTYDSLVALNTNLKNDTHSVQSGIDKQKAEVIQQQQDIVVKSQSLKEKENQLAIQELALSEQSNQLREKHNKIKEFVQNL